MTKSYQLIKLVQFFGRWAQLSQESDMLNRAIDQLPKRLMMVIRVKGAHVKFRLD